VFSRSKLLALAGVLVVAAAVAAALPGASARARVPRDFFGIAPQTPLTEADTSRMRHGGVDAVRVAVSWAAVQPKPGSGYDWSGLDQTMALLSRSHLEALPFLAGTPRWLAHRFSILPVSNARQRRAWWAFLRAAVERYGRHGTFWLEHGPGSADFVPRNPVRRWQLWNEGNFFYFATPASPTRYARLLKISRGAIKGIDGHAQIVMGGLFGNPNERPPRAMDAAAFLDRLYRVRGIKHYFDGVALHPYSRNTATLRRLTGRMRRVMLRHGDRRTGLYITEMGWGSQHDPRRVAFEVGRRAQARELRAAYSYLIGNRRRLNLTQVYWFSWKDAALLCNFCDSSGLFRGGSRFKPKPAWHTFTAIAHGRLR
jgi:hypothetical protein